MAVNEKTYVAGHNGMVGSAIVRRLESLGYSNIITATRDELDLLSQADVFRFFKTNAIDQVYLAAAKVGGIYANNTYPAEFIYQNLTIQSNIIHSAHLSGVNKLLFLGSSCIYPKYADQPMAEDSLLTGVLEPTNEPYAIAKIAGIKMCESYNRQYGCDYRSVMPTNLYGPNDNYHPENSHVIPALIRRFHEAVVNNEKEVIIWGSGNPKREFLHVDDMADASVFVQNISKDKYNENTDCMLSHVNVGAGVDVSIVELSKLVSKITKFSGEIIFDTNKPDGPLRKLMDISRLSNMGWSSTIDLIDGLKQTYHWYIEQLTSEKLQRR